MRAAPDAGRSPSAAKPSCSSRWSRCSPRSSSPSPPISPAPERRTEPTTARGHLAPPGCGAARPAPPSARRSPVGGWPARHLERQLLGTRAVCGLDPPCSGTWSRAHRLDELGAAEKQAGLVVDAIAGRDSEAHRLAEGAAAHRITVVVNAQGARQKPEAATRVGVAGRADDAELEPAHRPRAPAAEHDAALPRLQDAVDPLGPPDREQVEQAPAADVDQILAQQVLPHRHPLALEPEQREMRRIARALAQRPCEGCDLLVGVT